MAAYVGLLRAVNVGGTGKLSMSDLAQTCRTAGFEEVRTYIASGNVVFRSEGTETEVRSQLEDRLHALAGKPVGVLVRTASEIADVLARNPWPEAPGSRVGVLFTNAAIPDDPWQGVTGARSEQIHLGKRELFVLYPDGMGVSRLSIPTGKEGTARNMNTIAKLAEMSGRLDR